MRPAIVVIGASLGGLTALQTILSGLSPDFPVPLALVQHRSKSGRDLLGLVLQQQTFLRIRDVEDKDELRPGYLYVAPADYHLLIDEGQCALALDPPVNFSRPSIDVLFESAAAAYGSRVVAIVLTGSNSDGALGALKVKQGGGIVIVQDPAECESNVMPLAAMAAATVDYVIKVAEIPALLEKLCA